MIKIRVWWALKVGAFKMRLIARWCEQYGLTPVRMVTKGKTDYIIDLDGALHRIGKRAGEA